MKRNRSVIKKYLEENPSCFQAGILAAATAVCAVCLYVSDNMGSVRTNENGEAILEREQGEEETNASEMVSRYALFGHDPKGLYALDSEYKSRTYVPSTQE